MNKSQALAVLILIELMALSGCNNRLAINYTSRCIGGVEYMQFSSGVTVTYTPDGNVKACS